MINEKDGSYNPYGIIYEHGDLVVSGRLAITIENLDNSHCLAIYAHYVNLIVVGELYTKGSFNLMGNDCDFDIISGKVEIQSSPKCGPVSLGGRISLSSGMKITDKYDAVLNNYSSGFKKKSDSTQEAEGVCIEQVYDLWVGENQVTWSNKDDIPGIRGGGAAKYDPTTQTLTFSGNVTGIEGTFDPSGNGANKWKICSCVDLTIDGKASIDGEDSTYVIYAYKNLNIAGNYKPESIETYYTIRKLAGNTIDLSKAKIVNKDASTKQKSLRSETYNGVAIRPEVDVYVKVGKQYEKVNPSYYTVSYVNNTKKGKASIIVTGNGGSAKGSKTVTFNIVARSLSKFLSLFF
ncbi:MAG: hypothetical protein K6A74_03820 [Lachnospiraceae bacterium]|nr:hypothetical protein [Lachnospiraceae bacterium]